MRDYDGPDSEHDAEADTRPARLCDKCGRPRLIVRLVHVEMWRAREALFRILLIC